LFEITSQGGTIAGISKFLKEKNKDILCFIIDPPGTAVKYTKEDERIKISMKSAEEKDDKNTVIEGIGSSKLFLPLSQAVLDGVFRGEDQYVQ
jgi:cysteine synthase A